MIRVLQIVVVAIVSTVVSTAYAGYNCEQDCNRLSWHEEIACDAWQAVNCSFGEYSITYSDIRVTIRNNCYKPLWFAAHYRNVGGTWVTDGWWYLEYGESVFPFSTKNNIWFYHAYSSDRELTWDGYDFYDDVRNSGRTLGFIRVDMGLSEMQPYTYTLTCTDTERCRPMDAVGHGNLCYCQRFKWNGERCVDVPGHLDCRGADCGRLFQTEAECEAAYSGC